ncbi:unnamed protein product [Leptosia nina]|uniref:Fucosyltransferase n=1 Tax=Leptosia nina TaxID=320188 RepID=A0AAV1JZF0_9NEOP
MRSLPPALIYKYLTRRSYCTLTLILLFIIYYEINVSNIKNVYEVDYTIKVSNISKIDNRTNKPAREDLDDLRYVLLWSDSEQPPFKDFGTGRSVFEEKNCSWTNCYVTNDRNILSDYTEFDAVVFNGPSLSYLRSTNNMPRRRSSHQKYIFFSIESAANYPVCTDHWNGYFNWTWSYRLDSDIVWSYFVITNASGHVIAPNREVRWEKDPGLDYVKSLGEDLKARLRGKRKAVAWYVSNCDTASLREVLAKDLQEYMRIFQLRLVTFGECGRQYCPLFAMEQCLEDMGKDYFFYFAFENALSVDYVTEKVLHALNHDTVPVVFGGANYSRFLPPDSYIDAATLGPKKVVEKMAAAIKNREEYERYFWWRGGVGGMYRVRAANIHPETDPVCSLCAALNSPATRNISIYKEFDRWWTPETSCQDVIKSHLH